MSSPRQVIVRRSPCKDGKAGFHAKMMSTRVSAPASRKIPPFAFAFDIDGVLLRDAAPIPGASKALNYLHDNGIPFILLTNGGGKHETERVAELSKQLQVPLTVGNFVQSHTPFQDLIHDHEGHEGLKDKTILVTGGHGEKCRAVAYGYGFQKVVLPADILMAEPKIWPFNQVFTEYYQAIHRPLPAPIVPSDPAKSLKIDAVLVFNDPRDWAVDIQLILDLLLSTRGIIGTYSAKNGDATLPNAGWQQDGQPKLYFSNPDLFWAASYHLNRLGQGGFQASLDGVWRAVTGGAQLERFVMGKPHARTYSFAEKVLHAHRAAVLGPENVGRLARVFMVGDNPESDIKGANQYRSPSQTQWTSILVNTGVYVPGTVPTHKPKAHVENVLEAVKWALREQGWKNDLS